MGSFTFLLVGPWTNPLQPNEQAPQDFGLVPPFCKLWIQSSPSPLFTHSPHVFVLPSLFFLISPPSLSVSLCFAFFSFFFFNFYLPPILLAYSHLYVLPLVHKKLLPFPYFPRNPTFFTDPRRNHTFWKFVHNLFQTSTSVRRWIPQRHYLVFNCRPESTLFSCWVT